MRFDFPVELRRMTSEEGSGILVEFSDWNNAATSGKDLAEALDNARDCLGELIADRINRRQAFPIPSPAGSRRLIGPEFRLALKAGIWLAMREQGTSFADLAARLQLPSAEAAEKLIDPRRRTRPELLEAAAAALGKRVTLDLQDAA